MDINTLFKNVFMVGRVSAVHPETATIDVVFADRDNHLRTGVQVLQHGCKEMKSFWMPAVDDQVQCCFPPDAGGNGFSDGFCYGTIYNAVDVPPVDAASNTHVLDTPGNVVIKCGGTLDIQAAGGDVRVNGISLVHHTHGGVISGGGSTGTPQ